MVDISHKSTQHNQFTFTEAEVVEALEKFLIDNSFGAIPSNGKRWIEAMHAGGEKQFILHAQTTEER